MVNEQVVEVDISDRSKEIAASYLVGFIGFRDDREGKRTVSLGSGTLVKMAGVRGVLTAGHVAIALKDEERVGIVNFGPGKFQTLIFNPNDEDGFSMVSDEENGPGAIDIAFIRLPQETERQLAVNQAFWDMDERIRLVYESGKFLDDPVHVVMGVIGERSDHDHSNEKYVNSWYEAMMHVGSVDSRAVENDLIVIFRPNLAESIPAPTSYGGTSGGPLWVMSQQALHKVAGAAWSKFDFHIFGVAFYEELSPDGQLQILCQGPRVVDWLYERLAEEVGFKVP
ncbi:Hypothetical protein NGAL_HAMBI1145_29170 [Neorhizobium galegae bv. officinalis]|uniref:Uncharacterized protein n=1 Tax=Neorhizobium galegae bv. officinalis TaxID=323656 RepID=A0A0T7FKR2_NEOGA|nr:hypothetical protein [Neorhizobium galegae]CDZ35582.1 Hypothetical protein NGAL_HAMBI1145_29170 [Neorhizobium galegae bv. officinalis]